MWYEDFYVGMRNVFTMIEGIQTACTLMANLQFGFTNLDWLLCLSSLSDLKL